MSKSAACFALILFLAGNAANAAPAPWPLYTNQSYGFRLSYPGELIAGRAAEGGNGCEFHTPDGEFSVDTEARSFVMDDESLDAQWQLELRVLGDSVTYKRRAATWYVISGVTTDGAEYYFKLYTRGRRWVAFRITYPHAQAARYDPWVTRIEKSFIPFPKEENGAPPTATPAATPAAAERAAPPPAAAPTLTRARRTRAQARAAAGTKADVARSQQVREADDPWHIAQPGPGDYPLFALHGKLEGSGVVKISTDAAGRVAEVEIIQSADPVLDAAIKKHAQNWRGPPNASRTVPFAYRLPPP